MVRVVDYIMAKISQEYVKHIFTVTGRGILYLTDALAKNEKIEGISVHHEQAAAFAAIAYAQKTENIGVCLVSMGCASTNAMTGLLCAWQDGIPCVFISGQNMTRESVRFTGVPIRTYGSQETDIVSIVKPLTKYAVMITRPEQVVYELEKALYLSQVGRKGPVWIDVPLDIQNMRIEPKELEHYQEPQGDVRFPIEEEMEYVVNELEKAKRPVVLIGSGVRSSGAILQLQQLVDRIKIPVTFAHSAVDAYGAEKELSIGAVGSLCGTRAGNFAVQNADLLLVLGCRMSSMTTGEEYSKFAREAKVIVVDIDKEEHSKNTIKIDRLINVDIKDFLDQLLGKELKVTDPFWQDKCKYWKIFFPKNERFYNRTGKVDMYYLAEVFSQVLHKGTAFLCDAGLEELIFPSNIAFDDSMRCIHSVMQGSMGFALPAAIGAWYGGSEEVVAVIGDGSVMMNLQEFQTIAYHKLPIKIFIISNNVYSVIHKRQKDLFRTRTIGTNPEDGVSCPNFSKVADCFGLQYYHIADAYGLKEEVEHVLNMEGAVLCEIKGLEDQEYLRNSYTRDKNRRVVRRPIEDQAPFLERDIFLREMLIEPIDQ